MTEMKRVRLVNDPLRIGILTGKEMMRQERKLVQVMFPDRTQWIPADQIEAFNDTLMSPLDMLKDGQLGRPMHLRRSLTHAKLTGRLADVVYSMEATNTDFYAYQFKPVLKMLESPVNGVLIADEVGLGKTIEAGLVWTELRSRYDMRRLLVLCPAALRMKWKNELANKFGVAAQICDAREVLGILKSIDAMGRGFAIVASTQGLRPPREWEVQEDGSAVVELASFLRANENEERLVDLLVVDEAHHLRNPETQTNALAHLAKNVSEYTLLLTATPIHNRNEDLFSLLNLLDPDTFTSTAVFDEVLAANGPLVRARDIVLGQNLNYLELQRAIQEARAQPLLKYNRQLKMIKDDDLTQERLRNGDHRSRLAYRLETVNLLSHVVTRTRKRDVYEWRVIRQPVAEFVELAPVEYKFYEIVTNIVIEYSARHDANDRFLLAQPQRQMTSSMAASLFVWQLKLAELDESEETGDECEDASRKNKLGPLVTEIVLRASFSVSLTELRNVDTKYKRLLEILRSYLIEHPLEKVVVFSTFRATLDYLAGRLADDKLSCIVLKGGQRQTKDEIIARFQAANGPSVLLSSEVGGEGVDLQFSRVVVNYDLPWNPMRLEQRIGRIDRLGQTADRVLIWNVVYADTIDSRIYRRLYERLDLCRNALGDFEAILGSEIRRMTMDLLSDQLSAEQQEQRIDQTALALENRRLYEQQLEQDAASLIAYGDYILNQVHAAREQNRWIRGDDLRHYVLDYIGLHYPGCVMRQADADTQVWEIDLSERARYDLAEFIRMTRIPIATQFTMAARGAVRCCFSNRTTETGVLGIEVISQYHPLVRMVGSMIKERGDELTPAVALRINASECDLSLLAGKYVLAVAHWSFAALQDVERIVYAAAQFSNSAVQLESDIAERLAAASIACGADWLEARNTVELKQAFDVANDVLFHKLDTDFEAYTQEMIARNEDRADLQLRTLEQHRKRQLEKLEGVKEKLNEQGRISLVKATEGRIRALEARVEQQRMKIEGCRTVRPHSREIAIAIVEVT